MTLSWRRLGYLGFIIPLAALAVACAVFGTTHFTAIRIAMALAAVAVWVLGRRLNAAGPDEDGRALHLTFGRPMEWSVWLPVAGFLLTFA